MKTEVRKTREFDVCDSLGTRYKVYEYTIFNFSCAGGIDRWNEGDKEYKTENNSNVSHINHTKFQLPESNEWLIIC